MAIVDLIVTAPDQGTLYNNMLAADVLRNGGEIGLYQSPSTALFSYIGSAANKTTGAALPGVYALVSLDDATPGYSTVSVAVSPYLSSVQGIRTRQSVPAASSDIVAGFQAQLQQITALIPKAASMIPLPVENQSLVGTPGANIFANADHAHTTSLQKARIIVPTVANATGVVTWTYPQAYASPPLAIGFVENVEGATQPYVCNLVGRPGTLAAKFQVWQTQPVTLGAALANLINAVVNPTKAANGVYLNVYASLPTT